jgi:D-glycero-D-manno-heptose 1,7-bisphosphate phosphatase
MYLEIADRLGIDLSNIFAIGDSPKDMIAALSSGCKPLGVRTGNGSEIKNQMPDVSLFDDLYDAVEYVIDYDKQYILNI